MSSNKCLRFQTKIQLRWYDHSIQYDQMNYTKIYLGATDTRYDSITVKELLEKNKEVIVDTMENFEIYHMLKNREYEYLKIENLKVWINDCQVLQSCFETVDIRDGNELEITFNPTLKEIIKSNSEEKDKENNECIIII